jgi:hypothetical protein
MDFKFTRTEGGEESTLWEKSITKEGKISLETVLGPTSAFSIDLQPINQSKYLTIVADGLFDLLCADIDGNEFPFLKDCDGFASAAFSATSLRYDIEGVEHIASKLVIKNQENNSKKDQLDCNRRTQ